MTSIIALALVLVLTSAVIAGLRHAVRSDGYGRQPPPRSRPDEHETRSQVFARLAH